jgi:hypothetical protein
MWRSLQFSLFGRRKKKSEKKQKSETGRREKGRLFHEFPNFFFPLAIKHFADGTPVGKSPETSGAKFNEKEEIDEHGKEESTLTYPGQVAPGHTHTHTHTHIQAKIQSIFIMHTNRRRSYYKGIRGESLVQVGANDAQCCSRGASRE